MAKNYRILESQEKLIRKYVKEGLSAYLMSKKFNVSEGTLRYFLDKKKLKTKYKKSSRSYKLSEIEDSIKQYIEDGLYLVEISKKLNVPYQSLYAFLRNRNIKYNLNSSAGRHKLALEGKESLIKQYMSENIEFRDIAKMLDVSTTTLRNFMKLKGIRSKRDPYNFSKLSDEDKTVINYLIKNNWTVVMIARGMGVELMKLHRYLRSL